MTRANHFLFAFLLSVFFVKGQDFFPVNENAVFITGGGNDPTFNEYYPSTKTVWSGDTTINGKVFKKVYRTTDLESSDKGTYIGSFEEDSLSYQVTFIDSANQHYDITWPYDASIGDTLFFSQQHFTFYGYEIPGIFSNCDGSYRDSCRMVLTNIDSTETPTRYDWAGFPVETNQCYDYLECTFQEGHYLRDMMSFESPKGLFCYERESEERTELDQPPFPPSWWVKCDIQKIIANKEKINLKNKVSIYPNPVSSILQIAGTVNSYQIRDYSGKLLHQGEGNQIDVSFLPAGIFSLTINQFQQVKFVKE